MYSGPVVKNLTVSDGDAAFVLFGPISVGTRFVGCGFRFSRSSGTAPALALLVASGCVFFEGGARPSENLASFLLGRPMLTGILGANTVLQGINIPVGDIEGGSSVWLPIHTLTASLPYFIGLWADNGSGENASGFGHVDFESGSVHIPDHRKKAA